MMIARYCFTCTPLASAVTAMADYDVTLHVIR